MVDDIVVACPYGQRRAVRLGWVEVKQAGDEQQAAGSTIRAMFLLREHSQAPSGYRRPGLAAAGMKG